MSNKGCCFCLPSWVATIPGWLISVAALIMSFFGISLIGEQLAWTLIAAVNFIPYVLSAWLKDQVWPRVILMIFYIAISIYIATLCYIVPIIAGSEECYHYPDRCAEIRRQAYFLCACWSIPNIFIWIGLGYYIKSARDSKHAETHPYQNI